MVRSQDDPATEAVAQIDDGHTEAEPNHVGQRNSKCDDQNLKLHCGREQGQYINWIYYNTSKTSSEIKSAAAWVGSHHMIWDLRCISGRTWGSEWLPPTPGGWRSLTRCHRGHRRTYSVRRKEMRSMTLFRSWPLKNKSAFKVNAPVLKCRERQLQLSYRLESYL